MNLIKIKLLLLILCFWKEGLAQPSNKELLQRLDEIAKSQNLELVQDEDFPLLNPYGSTGTPYIFGFINSYGKEIGNSALFLTRRANEFYKSQESYNSIDLLEMYDYMLVYAVEPTKGSSLEFVEILNTPVGLKGLYLYYGSAFNNLSRYTYLNTTTPFEPEKVDWSQLSLPIIISGETVTMIIRKYGDKWIELTERDW